MTEGFQLGSIHLGYEFGDPGAPFRIRIFEVSDVNDDTSEGATLLDVGVVMPSDASTTESVATLQIEFNGVDQIDLAPGAYAIEFDEGPGGMPLVLAYDSTDPYLAGRVYPDSVAFRGGAAATDFTMSIDGVGDSGCNAGAGEVTPFGISAFAAADQDVDLDRTHPDPIGQAIDGDLETGSYLTPSGTNVEAIAALDLGASTAVDGLRVAKFTDDIEDNGGADTMDLRILYATDGGPLHERIYLPVSGMQNGYGGADPISAVEVRSDGSIIGDSHSPADGLWWSVEFESVEATAIALQFVKTGGDGGFFVHYPTLEFVVMSSVEPCCVTDFSGDGATTSIDLAALLGAWGPNPGHAADFDLSGVVDSTDLAAMLGQWGACP